MSRQLMERQSFAFKKEIFNLSLLGVGDGAISCKSVIAEDRRKSGNLDI
jgi:hypothetical protein